MLMSQRIKRLKELADIRRLNERQTIEYLLLPLLVQLGWDIFNPSQVVPEAAISYGVKSSDKADIILYENDKAYAVIECKRYGADLNDQRSLSQLYRYYAAVNPKFGILTNGDYIKIYTDSDKKNIMDKKPMMCLRLNDDKQVEILHRILSKEAASSNGGVGATRNMGVTIRFLEQICGVI